jgi:hypothetical protein
VSVYRRHGRDAIPLIARDRPTVLVEPRGRDLHDIDTAPKTWEVLPGSDGYRRHDERRHDDSAQIARTRAFLGTRGNRDVGCVEVSDAAEELARTNGYYIDANVVLQSAAWEKR